MASGSKPNIQIQHLSILKQLIKYKDFSLKKLAWAFLLILPMKGFAAYVRIRLLLFPLKLELAAPGIRIWLVKLARLQEKRPGLSAIQIYILLYLIFPGTHVGEELWNVILKTPF